MEESPKTFTLTSETMLEYETTDRLHRAAFETTFPRVLGDWDVIRPWGSPTAVAATAPVQRSEEVRTAVRGLLREGGHKPSGRGKPSSEYLVQAVEQSSLPVINLAVDACNVVSLQSGIPISVVDLNRTQGSLQVRLGDAGSSYVFNASGQEIRLDGLLCLWDAGGPCANAVRDSHRTKTTDQTTRTLSVLWGPASHAEHVEQTLDWYMGLLASAGASVARL